MRRRSHPDLAGGDLRGVVDDRLAVLGPAAPRDPRPAGLPAGAGRRSGLWRACHPAARVAQGFAAGFGLVIAPPPLEVRSFPVSVFWHRRNDRDPRTDGCAGNSPRPRPPLEPPADMLHQAVWTHARQRVRNDGGTDARHSAKPTEEISVREVFGIDTDMKVRASPNAATACRKSDPTYKFDPDTTLAILAGFAYNRRVMIQGLSRHGQVDPYRKVAARLNWPCVRVNLDSHISRIDLIGKDAIKLRDGKQVTEFPKASCPGRCATPWPSCSMNTMRAAPT